MKWPPREAGALHFYVVVNVVVLCTHTHESGALLRFFLVGKKKKKKTLSGFSPRSSWAGRSQIFYFCLLLLVAKPPLSSTYPHW